MEPSASTIPTPPRAYQELVCGPRDDLEDHFDEVGRVLATWLREAGLVAAGRRLLDIGCGCGRLARHLLQVPAFRYTGFDRHPGMIRWCRSEIGARTEAFEFHCHPVVSAYDHRDGHHGSIPASRFRFPYGDGSYDSIVAASVFSHMPLAETIHYLRECRRVLAQGGRLLGSVFVARGPAHDDGIDFHYSARDFRRGVEVVGLRPGAPDGHGMWIPRDTHEDGEQRWFYLRRA